MDVRVTSVIQTYQLHLNAKPYVTSTAFISDCLSTYQDLDTYSYTRQTINHTISFIDMCTGAHMNTVESTWCHVKPFLNLYNQTADYIYHLAHYMFVVRCQSSNVDHITKFISMVATMDWSATPPLYRSHVTT